MNYKVVVDAGHGGSDSGNVGNGLIEKDYALLISNYIKGRLDELGIDSITTRDSDVDLSVDERINVMQAEYGLSDDVLVVSNHLNKGGEEGLEVIYALRNDDDFSETIAEQIVNAGGVVNKYYQLRDPDNTQDDYYPLLSDTPQYETVMIEYGYVDNVKDANRIKNNYQEFAEAVVRAIAIYTGNQYVPLPGNEYYIVKAGDSLWKIAQSYGISVDDLKSTNNLTSNVLSIGQLLAIPGQNIDSNGNTYIVKSGDSLWKIAQSYGVTVQELKNTNSLTSDSLSIGQILVIPTSNSSSDTTYVVKAGDSLWKIAQNYGITVDALKSANGLTSNILSIGQTLVIPSNNSSSGITYVVKAGDSLWKIAQSYGISVDDLKKANNLTSNILSIGQVLKIPR